MKTVIVVVTICSFICYTFKKVLCFSPNHSVCLSVCLSACLSVCLCVCHQDCDEMSGLSSTVSNEAIALDNSSTLQHYQDDPFPLERKGEGEKGRGRERERERKGEGEKGRGRKRKGEGERGRERERERALSSIRKYCNSISKYKKSVRSCTLHNSLIFNP